ncbi:hypothetical protein, conserved [Eimeria acervulina]|uniref:Uncharacterized protein n=1 Tax=Eimeria acervulina TaxID=5801 RepID=U6GBM9_EIMAC|nr:hypothetical protein, conserved [Eimeria acervulina]CDI76743.1 hypothetical protein, conserved [Eimeria acervulina]
MREEAVPHKMKKSIGHAFLRSHVASLISVVGVVVVYAVWRCALHLGEGKWRPAATGRLLAAGGEEEEGSFACRYAGEGEDEGGHTGEAEYPDEATELLARGSSVISTFVCVAESAQSLLLRLPVADRHKAACLLFSGVIVEFSALLSLVGEGVRTSFNPATAAVNQVILNIAGSIPLGSIRGAESKYYRLRLIIKKLKRTRHQLPVLPEEERMQKLRELLFLQELSHTQIKAAFDTMESVVTPLGNVDRGDLAHAMAQLSHTVYARKNQVMRDGRLREWLTVNESPWKHSPLLPRNYLDFILLQDQPNFNNLVAELTDPTLPFARPRRAPLGMRTTEEEIQMQRAPEFGLAEEGVKEQSAFQRRGYEAIPWACRSPQRSQLQAPHAEMRAPHRHSPGMENNVYREGSGQGCDHNRTEFLTGGGAIGGGISEASAPLLSSQWDFIRSSDEGYNLFSFPPTWQENKQSDEVTVDSLGWSSQEASGVAADAAEQNVLMDVGMPTPGHTNDIASAVRLLLTSRSSLLSSQTLSSPQQEATVHVEIGDGASRAPGSHRGTRRVYHGVAEGEPRGVQTPESDASAAGGDSGKGSAA